jgi:uncharacterized protein (TIGR02996 family)
MSRTLVQSMADPVERAFINAIRADPDDQAARLIYADWLEERDDPRGEYLRLEAALAALGPDDARFSALDARRLQLHGEIDFLWRVVVRHRSHVLNCGAATSQPPPVRFAFRCPKRWEGLRPTDDPAVRHCDACRQEVHFCATAAEAEERAVRGECVAIGARLAAQAVADHPEGLEPDHDVTMGVMARPEQGEEDLDQDERDALSRWGLALFARRPRRPWRRFWG